MIEHQHKSPIRLWKQLKQQTFKDCRIFITSFSVAGCVILLRLTGLLQTWEWATLDLFFRLRPPQAIEDRILIVGIDEENLRKVGHWPIPDRLMAELLQKLHSLQPRAIGLDIYRDLPVEPGHAQLQKTFQNIPNLIAIEKIKDLTNPEVPAPQILKNKNQFGFNNVVLDGDGKVRRSMLYWWVNNQPHQSFALRLALIDLKTQGIQPKAAKGTKNLQLGKAVFVPFEANHGGYVRADAAGYQILGNFQKPSVSFPTVFIGDVLTNKVPAELVRDRIVLIGSTAVSLNDFFYTPYSGNLSESAKPIPGVELQANFLSQILTAAETGRGLIKVWPEPIEWFWIYICAWLGTILIWRSPSATKSIFIILLAATSLTLSSYLLFLVDWWIPLIPPLLSLFTSAISITSYIAHTKEELKRSKEFLQNVINAIPDPVFVKDKQHRWVVLNDAYCQFLGYSLSDLKEKSDYEFFPQHEADIFWQQDELVLQGGQPIEHEEELTDALGNTHFIAIKRSLHKDGAGNLFLVGVMRDITERKKLEEELKRTAAELVNSNHELKISEDRLRYLAYHDSLTGLPNRKLFSERLAQSLDWASKNQQLVALLFLDLDGFKQINDTKGHDIGDLLLQGVAVRLSRCLRGSDTVSRLGGDEFTVILPGIPGKSDIKRVAEKILQTITQPFELNGQTITITLSIGIAVFPLDGDNIETLTKNADVAMYRAKQLGKNQYDFF